VKIKRIENIIVLVVSFVYYSLERKKERKKERERERER
jgi:hypothetical protein